MGKRSYQRGALDLRPIDFQLGIQKFATGSVLVSFGDTRVICSASVETSVPSFAKSQGQGWLTAEYSMLPASTNTRSSRETKGPKGRTQEIQRLIGRALRSVVDLKAMPERSITIDCDVLQADGGTRTASITGGFVALALAVNRAQGSGVLPAGKIITGQVAAISAGIRNDEVLVDLDYSEDSSCDADCNIVLTSDGAIVEVQGTAEQRPFTVQKWNEVLKASQDAIAKLIRAQREILKWN